jgi:hypothetical protein
MINATYASGYAPQFIDNMLCFYYGVIPEFDDNAIIFDLDN